MIRDGINFKNMIGEHGAIKRNLDLKEVAQGIAVANKTGMFKYDNPNKPTRRDYAQFLARDIKTLQKISGVK